VKTEEAMKKFCALAAFISTFILLTAFVPPAYADDDEPDGAALSGTQTSYIGARLLKGGENVVVGGVETGPYEDEESDRYSYWQGDTHFAGVKNPETGNKVDIVSEWYWFESSIPRNADFYVGVIKVKSSPNPVDDWYLKEENGWYGNIMWPDDVVQLLEVRMDPSGDHGGIRWDWCVPFDSYKWEPEKNIEVASGYSAGFDAEGGFSEGGILKDLTDKSNIQAKGYINGKHSVSTKYTITLYKWQVLVSSGADNMRWQMRILSGGNNQDSAYHEYFVVIQAEKGSPVHIPEIIIAANFKHSLWYWFDGYEALSAAITDINFTPPPACYVDDPIADGECLKEGICVDGAAYCDPSEGVWACNYPDEYEEEEITCDGLDNDCDGKVDEPFAKLGLTCDGDDGDGKKNGIWVCNEEGTGLVCDEDPCAGKECGNGCGECDEGYECKASKCIALEEGGSDDPFPTCNGITEVGECDGNWLIYCAGGELVEQYCAFCCGFDKGAGYYACLPKDECPEPEECVPDCAGKDCGADGCGGICGICGEGEVCSEDGECADEMMDTESKYAVCGECPEGWICSGTGQCVPGADNNRPDANENLGGNGTEAGGCTAVGTTRGSAGAALLLVLLTLCAFALRRTSRRTVLL